MSLDINGVGNGGSGSRHSPLSAEPDRNDGGGGGGGSDATPATEPERELDAHATWGTLVDNDGPHAPPADIAFLSSLLWGSGIAEVLEQVAPSSYLTRTGARVVDDVISFVALKVITTANRISARPPGGGRPTFDTANTWLKGCTILASRMSMQQQELLVSFNDEAEDAWITRADLLSNAQGPALLATFPDTQASAASQRSIPPMDSRAVQIAVLEAIPGQLGQHAASEVTEVVRATRRLAGSVSTAGEAPQAETSLSSKAGLQFGTAIVGDITTRITRKPVKEGAVVALTAVLEYIAAEVLELAARRALKDGTLKIIPSHVLCAIKQDEELDILIPNCTVSGVSPAALLGDPPADCRNMDGQEGIVFTCQDSNWQYFDHENEKRWHHGMFATYAQRGKKEKVAVTATAAAAAVDAAALTAPGTENLNEYPRAFRVLRDTVLCVSDRMICNLAARAGVVALEQSAFEKIRRAIAHFTYQIIHSAVNVTSMRATSTEEAKMSLIANQNNWLMLPQLGTGLQTFALLDAARLPVSASDWAAEAAAAVPQQPSLPEPDQEKDPDSASEDADQTKKSPLQIAMYNAARASGRALPFCVVGTLLREILEQSPDDPHIETGAVAVIGSGLEAHVISLMESANRFARQQCRWCISALDFEQACEERGGRSHSAPFGGSAFISKQRLVSTLAGQWSEKAGKQEAVEHERDEARQRVAVLEVELEQAKQDARAVDVVDVDSGERGVMQVPEQAGPPAKRQRHAEEAGAFFAKHLQGQVKVKVEEVEDEREERGYQVRFTDSWQSKFDEVAAIACAAGADTKAIADIRERRV
jgi:histone H2A